MKNITIDSQQKAARIQELAEQVFNNDNVPFCGPDAPPEILEWLTLNGYKPEDDPYKSHLILLIRGVLPFHFMKAVAEYWKNKAITSISAGAFSNVQEHAISSWFDAGVKNCATHMLILHDTFDNSVYPVYVFSSQQCLNRYNNPGEMQAIEEVYDLSADKDEQLKASRNLRLPTTHVTR